MKVSTISSLSSSASLHAASNNTNKLSGVIFPDLLSISAFNDFTCKINGIIYFYLFFKFSDKGVLYCVIWFL